MTPQEQKLALDERMILLIEECAEVQQIASKIIRYGIRSYNPTIENSMSNRELLEKELGDLSLIMSMMISNGDIDIINIEENAVEKRSRIGKYLNHNKVE